MLARSTHDDTRYFASLCEGRRALGPIEPAGLYRRVVRPARVQLHDWLAHAPRRNREIISAVQSSGDIELDAEAWRKREKEIQTGAVQGPFRVHEVDLDSIAVHPTFPVWERSQSGGWKVRNIENLKASGGNDTVEAVEAYTPHDLDYVRALIRHEKDLWGDDACLSGFSSDYRGAFRQSPLHPEQIPWMWSAVWHPTWKVVVLLKNLGQVFGGAGSQFNYVRDPAAMCRLMRYFFLVPMFHYSDDAWCFERDGTIVSAWYCWVFLNKLIGWVLDDDKTLPPSGVVRL